MSKIVEFTFSHDKELYVEMLMNTFREKYKIWSIDGNDGFIYDELVEIRHKIAELIGEENYQIFIDEVKTSTKYNE